jgi:hypothetical protein
MSVPPYRPGPFDWRHLDQQAAAELWVELEQWVEWLRERYDFGREIRPCWFQHGALVEELTAAMVAHRASYQEVKDPHHHGPAAWHYQVLRPMVARMTAITDFEQCTQDACGFTPTPVRTLDTLSEFIAADVADRPTGSSGRSFALDPVLSAIDSAAAEAAVPGSRGAMPLDEMVTLIDHGKAEPEDPSDDFTAVTIDGVRWEFSDDTEDYRPVQ